MLISTFFFFLDFFSFVFDVLVLLGGEKGKGKGGERGEGKEGKGRWDVGGYRGNRY